MKALIISDDESPVPQIAAALHSHGYETIRYKWLIKALDNVAEIEPDLTVINVRDYPRHWKIFAQFAKSSGKAAGIILYAPAPLSDSERSKAEAIGVNGWFSFDGQGAAEFDALLGGVPRPAAVGSVSAEDGSHPEEIPIPSVDDFLADAPECRPSSEPPAESLGAGAESEGLADDDVLIPSVDTLFSEPAEMEEMHSESEDFSEDEDDLLDSEGIVAIPSVDVVAVAEAFVPSVDVVAVSDAPILSVDDCCVRAAEGTGTGQDKVRPGKSLLRKIEQIYEKE
ncbi:MAG: hypothetical protein K2H09_01455 [Treponemataceae bacterium]|nr:hypothetical protein [Treponemataceae bacterium]